VELGRDIRCTTDMRLVLLGALLGVAALAAVSDAATKEGAQAHLTSAVPLGAEPG
jgi:hypothetical protein